MGKWEADAALGPGELLPFLFIQTLTVLSLITTGIGVHCGRVEKFGEIDIHVNYSHHAEIGHAATILVGLSRYI